MKPSTQIVGALQWDVRRREVAHNLATAQRLVRSAAQQGARLLVLPEMWPTSFAPDADDALLAESSRAVDQLRELSGELNLVLVGSSYERTESGQFNRAQVFDRGREVLSYRKIHLFSPAGEHRYFQSGDALGVVATSVGRLGVVICYDIRFPELTRLLFHHQVQLMAVPAQWPSSRTLHWNALLQARAIENQCFVIGANRCGLEAPIRGGQPLEFPGNSQVVNPAGEVMAVGDACEGSVLAEVSLRQIATLHRLLPLRRDTRGEVYARLWGGGPLQR
jgi:omega-amidase